MRPLSVIAITRGAIEFESSNNHRRADLWPALEAGKLTLPIDKTFPLEQVAEALAMMKANRHFGKIVLTT